MTISTYASKGFLWPVVSLNSLLPFALLQVLPGSEAQAKLENFPYHLSMAGHAHTSTIPIQFGSAHLFSADFAGW